MSLTLEQAQARMFNRFEMFLGDMNVVAELDPELDADLLVRAAWLRSDGTSIGYEQVSPNELVFRLQVPMDSVIALQDKVDAGEVDLDSLVGEHRAKIEEELGS